MLSKSFTTSKPFIREILGAFALQEAFFLNALNLPIQILSSLK